MVFKFTVDLTEYQNGKNQISRIFYSLSTFKGQRSKKTIKDSI